MSVLVEFCSDISKVESASAQMILEQCSDEKSWRVVYLPTVQNSQKRRLVSGGVISGDCLTAAEVIFFIHTYKPKVLVMTKEVYAFFQPLFDTPTVTHQLKESDLRQFRSSRPVPSILL